MATVYIGGASIDERGKASGGQAGNQTGRELRKQAYYDHTKGWYVFRARNPLVREDIAVAMENSIANRNIGYDQLQNQTLWNQIKSKGYDPTRATTPCETDCARLVRVCVAYGFDQNGLDASTVPDWYTGTLPKLIMGLGEFVKYTDNKHCKGGRSLARGDILCTRSKGHTVVALNNGDLFDGTVEPEDIPLGSRILRDGDEGTDVEALQIRLDAAGYDPGEIDGIFGPNTEAAVRALQKDAGILVDGEFGPDSYAALLALEVDDDAPEAEDRPATGNVLISGGDAYLRTGPGKNYPKAGVAENGDRFTYANEDEWVPVLVGGRILWVSGKYAKVEG
jgi:hypothetical protein|nr:MAG TPA: N acetylmuramidase [Caudoviricetes sp.]